MNRRPRSTVLRAIPLAVPVVALLVAGAAQASSVDPDAGGKGRPAAVATQSVPSSKLPTLAPTSALAGYRQVTSTAFSDPVGSQVSGTVACPSGTSLVGGGAVISSTSLSENLNSSVPLSDGKTWQVYVNNSSSTNGTFTVYADCVRKVAKYAVVIGTGVSNGAGAQTTAQVACPQGTVPLGGGGFSSSGSTAVNLNSSLPTAKGWRTDVNNNTTTANTATAYAVCGKKPAGYAQVSGTPATVNASSQTQATVACPSGTLVLGGGGYSSSGSVAVDLNSSSPFGSTGWQVYQNNGTTASNTITAYAVCATAS